MIFWDCIAVTNEFFVTISRQYRSILRDCQEQLDSNDDTNEDKDNAAAHSELLYKLELIWNLVEILVIERPTSTKLASAYLYCLNLNSFSDGIVLPQLIQWVSLHFPQADEKARNVLTDLPEQPESHPDFWDALLLFLFQGKTKKNLNFSSSNLLV